MADAESDVPVGSAPALGQHGPPGEDGIPDGSHHPLCDDQPGNIHQGAGPWPVVGLCSGPAGHGRALLAAEHVAVQKETDVRKSQ